MSKFIENTPYLPLSPGWKLMVELEAITWDDLKKLAAIAEGMEWLNHDVNFSFDDDGCRVAIVLEEI